jgi:hypothetical protein
VQSLILVASQAAVSDGLLSSPLVTGVIGAIGAAGITGFVAWWNARHQRKAVKEERQAAVAAADVAWERQRELFREQRAADREVFESQQEEQRAQLQAQIEANARSEVRARTVTHLEGILDALNDLEKELPGMPSVDRLRAEDAFAVKRILGRVDAHVGHCGPEVRMYLGVLLKYEDALVVYGQKDRVNHPEVYVLRNLVRCARELVFADLRGDPELVPDWYLEWIQGHVEAYREYEEFQIRWTVQEAELHDEGSN